METLSIWEQIAVVCAFLAICVIVVTILYGIYLNFKKWD